MSENAKSLSAIIRPRLFGSALLSVLLLTAGIVTAQAQQSNSWTDPNAPLVGTDRQPLGQAEQSILFNEIESYFDGIDTLKSKFLQFNMDNSVYSGILMMDRPGKMRIEYDDPIPYLIVSDGDFYIFVDKELQEVSYIPLGLTPANMLLRKPMKLQEDLTVVDAARDQGMLFITVAQKEAPDAGTLTLTFQEDPLVLRQWTVIDAQGLITRVVLDDVETGIPLDRNQFFFVDPWVGKRQNN